MFATALVRVRKFVGSLTYLRLSRPAIGLFPKDADTDHALRSRRHITELEIVLVFY